MSFVLANMIRCSQRIPVRPCVSLLQANFGGATPDHFTHTNSFATSGKAVQAEEELHQLHWPPSPEALAANPVLAHMVRTAAKNARADLASRLQSLLNKPQGRNLSLHDLQNLKDGDIAHQLQLCGQQSVGARSQLIGSLYSILQQHQPAMLDEPSSRSPAEPAQQDEAAESVDTAKKEFARIATPMEVANMLVEAKADDVCILDVSSQCNFTEHMVLATGRSHRHIQAAAQAVAYQMSLQCTEVSPGSRPSVEGQDESDWCVVDAGSIIVHVFSEDARQMYNLESLWRTAHNLTRIAAPQTAQNLQSLDAGNLHRWQPA